MTTLHIVLDWVLWLLLISSWVFEVVVRRQRKQRDELIAKNKGLRAQVDANSADVLKSGAEMVTAIVQQLEKSDQTWHSAVAYAIEKLSTLRGILTELREALEKVRQSSA
jgi:biopolymer transport protein ExbB/TolQ